ncbi:hypothetical protein [Rhodococcus marinonascens]|uniref:hypothetical protein n=1 Tax=Rhodococcus marinonascens TaxID=38311 RepID=UPI0009325090|nr:hypothetical protein [Rhodococcus marinonascens]
MSILTTLRESEPVRLYVYPILVVLVGVLLARGVIDAQIADLITAAATGILGITAAEAARAKVTPAARVAEAVVDVADRVQRAGASPQVQAVLDRARAAVTNLGTPHRVGE